MLSKISRSFSAVAFLTLLSSTINAKESGALVAKRDSFLSSKAWSNKGPRFVIDVISPWFHDEACLILRKKVNELQALEMRLVPNSERYIPLSDLFVGNSLLEAIDKKAFIQSLETTHAQLSALADAAPPHFVEILSACRKYRHCDAPTLAKALREAMMSLKADIHAIFEQLEFERPTMPPSTAETKDPAVKNEVPALPSPDLVDFQQLKTEVEALKEAFAIVLKKDNTVTESEDGNDRKFVVTAVAFGLGVNALLQIVVGRFYGRDF